MGVAHMVSSVAAVFSSLESSRRERKQKKKQELARSGLLSDSSCFGHFLLLLLLPFI
uniref:Uncharacterized protein n=1 Tax=Arundo donax TaxID=35708 RepID=A0A0A9I3D3_ARUDO